MKRVFGLFNIFSLSSYHRNKKYKWTVIKVSADGKIRVSTDNKIKVYKG